MPANKSFMSSSAQYNLDPDDGSLDKLANYIATGGLPGDAPLNQELVTSRTVTLDVLLLEPHEQEIAIQTTEVWAALIGYEVEVTNSPASYIRFTREESDNSGGFSQAIYIPETNDWRFIVNVNPSTFEPDNDNGIWGKSTMMHEIGHALGLLHPGPYNGTTDENGVPWDRDKVRLFPNDHMQFSIMSYFGEQDKNGNYLGGVAMTPMIADIIAIQSIYGKAEKINHGDTTYGIGSNTETYLDALFADFISRDVVHPTSVYGITIYDTDGYDTIDFSNHNKDNPGYIVVPLGDDEFYIEAGFEPQRVNLNPGYSSDVYNSKGTLIIARDTLIERYYAGSGDDHITGNIADNWIEGRGGNDTILGGPGNDLLSGGPGGDTLDGGPGNDTASYRDSNERVDVRLSGSVVQQGHAEGDTLIDIEHLIGSAYHDTLAGNSASNDLSGGSGNDLLWGSGGDDFLKGGSGDDRLVGGNGSDTAIYSSSPAGVTVRLHNSSAANGHAEGDTFPYSVAITWTDDEGIVHTDSLPDIENLTGSLYDDILAGDRRDNILTGNGGNDTLYGGPGGGDDHLYGNDGNDKLYGGVGDDFLYGGPGDDQLSGGPGIDTFVFAPDNGHDTVLKFTTGEDSIDLTEFDTDTDYRPSLTLDTDGATLDLNEVGGGSVLLADLTTLPTDDSFIV